MPFQVPTPLLIVLIQKNSVYLSTFRQIIGRFDAAVVKFDQTYPYGDAQDAFKEVTESLLSHENLIMTEVHVAGVVFSRVELTTVMFLNEIPSGIFYAIFDEF